MPLCKGCGAQINWLKTQKGKNTPIDVQETTIYVTGTQTMIKGHQPHWATCPNAKDFKKNLTEG